MRWVQTQLKPVPEELKAALAEEAMRRRTNVADVIVSELAGFFNVPVASTARRKAFRPSLPYGDTIVLRVPDNLLWPLVEHAREQRTTRTGAALSVLAALVGVDYEPPQRGPQEVAA